MAENKSLFSQSDTAKLMNYSANVISEFVGAQRHRKDVAMYLSATNMNGILNQLFEITDNSTDESVQMQVKYRELITAAKKVLVEKSELTDQETELLNWINSLGPELKLPPCICDVTIHNDGSVTVQDHGRGLPCDKRNKVFDDGTVRQVPGILSLVESDSAGAKASHGQGGYDASGVSGMHGAGLAVSCSCSLDMDIVAKSYGGLGQYHVSYHKGERNKVDEATGEPIGEDGLEYLGELEPHPNKYLAMCGAFDTGTTIHYMPDPELFTLTYNNINYDFPFIKDIVIERLRISLMGMENRDAAVVRFKYRDDPVIEITPYDITPESLLGVTNEDNLFTFPIETTNLSKKDPSYFKGKIYLYYNPNTVVFTSNTVVNRLPQTLCQADDILKNNLSYYFDSEIKKRYKGKGLKKNSFINYFHAYIIFYQMTGAQYSGQVKEKITNTNYQSAFENLLYKKAPEIIAYFNASIEAYLKKLDYFDKMEKELAAIDKAAEEAKQKHKETEAISDNIKDIIEDKTKYSLYIKSTKNSCYLAIIPSEQPIEKVTCVVGEGNSVVSTCPPSLFSHPTHPVELIAVTGKPPNLVTKSDVDTLQKIQKLKIIWLWKHYKRIILTPDADGDGLHIVVLLLYIICKYRPDWLQQGKVYIAKTPLATVTVKSAMDVKTPDGIIHLLPKVKNFIQNESQLDAVIRAGASLYHKYAGLADLFTDSSINFKFEYLLTKNEYIMQVKPPTDAELKELEATLRSGDDIKKEFVRNTLYTETELINRLTCDLCKSTRINFNNPNLSVIKQPHYQNHNIYSSQSSTMVYTLMDYGLVDYNSIED